MYRYLHVGRAESYYKLAMVAMETVLDEKGVHYIELALSDLAG